MLRKQLWIGCLFIVAGIAWPTVSIVRGLTKFSDVYRTAATQHQDLRSAQQQEVIASVEQGISSIVGGLIIGLFGIGLALGAKRDSGVDPDETVKAAAS